MQGILEYLFGAASFMPHGYCLLWRPDLVALHAVSDALIALAYFSIPVSLVVFVKRRQDLEFGWVLRLFALFILACGLTHLIALITLWQPIYGLQGMIKFLTALLSLATAALVWPVVPRALALPGSAELRDLNTQLLSGIEAEREAARRLQGAYADIERRVAERTRQLAEANERLRTEIAERKRAEAHQEMLLAELRHRVRNTLAIVKSIATQTRQHSASMDHFSRSFNSRVQALADTHSLLFESNWTRSTLAELIRQHLRPYDGEQRSHLAGPRIAVRPKSALSLSLVLHELAANAAKYGALSTAHGEIRIDWHRLEDGDAPRLELVWSEAGGPRVAPPSRRGFGSDVIEFTIKLEFQGTVETDYQPDGVKVRFVLPLVEDSL